MSPATSTPSVVNLVQKSQLARLLATENITIEHSNSAKTAMFDTNKRKLILPIWSKATEDLYDMLVAHEVGHALITPREDVYMPVCKRMSPSNPAKFFPYLNIVEDIRVDNEVKDRYPGVRRSYYNAYKELVERDFFRIAKYGGDLSSLSFGDRVNIYSKIGHLGFVTVPFNNEEQAILEEAMSVASFDEVIAVAQKIWNKSSENQDKQPKPEANPEGNQSVPNKNEDTEDNDEESAPTKTNDQDENPSESQDQDQGGSSDPSADDTDDKNQKDSDKSQNGNSGNAETLEADSDSQPNPQPSSEPADLQTVDSLEKNLAGLTSNKIYDNYNYFNMPSMNLDNIVFPYKKVIDDLSPMRTAMGFCGDKIYATILERNKNFVSNLAKQFEQKMAADECRRTRTSKTGQLDMRKIANYKFSDDLFVKNQLIADGKSHGMVFIMDWSGSMGEYLLPTVEQLLSLCMFCRKMNIPFEVYAFTNSQPNLQDMYGSTTTPKMTATEWYKQMHTNGSCSHDYTAVDRINYNGDTISDTEFGEFLQITQFGMIQFLSSKMNTQEFKNAAELFCQCARNSDSSNSDLSKDSTYCNMDRKYGLSGTPLNEAIVVGMTLVNQFKAAHRLDIVNTVILTDGDPTSSVCGNRNSYNTILNLRNRQQMVIRSTQQRSPYGGTVDEMLGLAEVFRAVTGTNLISIRLTTSRHGVTLAKSWSMGDAKEENRMIKEWKEQDFFSYRTAGFTESFVIDAKYEIPDDDFLETIKDGASVSAITRAFIKGNSKKTSSRVLLSRFSDLIAKKVMA